LLSRTTVRIPSAHTSFIRVETRTRRESHTTRAIKLLSDPITSIPKPDTDIAKRGSFILHHVKMEHEDLGLKVNNGEVEVKIEHGGLEVKVENGEAEVNVENMEVEVKVEDGGFDVEIENEEIQAKIEDGETDEEDVQVETEATGSVSHQIRACCLHSSRYD
jgi:hypothetical protein